MIIDLILDRKDGATYSPKQFYNQVSEYGEVGFLILMALDDGVESDIKGELCDYIIKNDYNDDICTFIKNVNWLNN
jgi:hypothetical protein